MGKATDFVLHADRGFVLRTPALPLQTFCDWQSALDQRRYLGELAARPEVREALFVATPNLAQSIERWQRDPDSETGRQVELSLARYIARMAGRATPFGLFSAVSAGSLGKQTSLELAPATQHRRRTRIDNDYLFALIEAIARQPDVRARLRYQPNGSLYEAGDRLRFAEARLAGKERSYQLAAIDSTPYLLATLKRARGGARLVELVEGLVADDPEVTRDEAVAYVDELVSAQVIVPQLGIAVTGVEPIDALIEQCTAADVAQPSIVLRAVRDALAAIDARGIGNDIEDYLAIATMLEALPASVELSRLFQVDMVKPASLTLDAQVAVETARVLRWLHRIGPPMPARSLDAFRAAFEERYGGRTVPLTEVLDEESGIGFEAESGPGSEGAPLLAGLSFPAQPTPQQVSWGPVERHMKHRLATAIASGEHEICLEEGELAKLTSDRAVPVPDALHALIRVQHGLRDELTILFEGASGPSGARMLGRFCHASAEIDAMVRTHLRAEEAHRTDAVFAEIVHLNEGRIGNIVCRPVLRDYEIVFLGLSGAPDERQLPVDDLLVSVVGDRIVLTSRRLGCEIIPRLTTAHNYRLRSLGIYRFLCALQGGASPGWSWGALSSMPFLPRVRIGKTIVSRATWNVPGSELDAITKSVRELAHKSDRHTALSERHARCAAMVAALRVRLRLPRFIVIVDGDNELPIDLENPMLVQVFADEVCGRESVEILEWFPLPEASPVHDATGSFANQFVLTFVRPVRASISPIVRRQPPPIDIRRTFPPGSSWLYVKLYAGTGSIDRLLRDAIAPVVRDALARGDIKHWFFIRYSDPHHHLRVRFAGDPFRLICGVLPSLERALASLPTDGVVWKVQLDTYEREVERYGGDQGIELAESLFWIDSEAVLEIVEILEGDAGAEARWRLALRGAETLLQVLGFDPADRHRIFDGARDALAREFGTSAGFFAPIGERYKRERGALEELFSPDTARDAVHELSPGFAILDRRNHRLGRVAEELRARDRAGLLFPALDDIAWSYVHMHVNRLLHASQRAQELVLYDLLRRLHEARRAREMQRG